MLASNITYSKGSIVDGTFTETPIRRVEIPDASKLPQTPEQHARTELVRVVKRRYNQIENGHKASSGGR